MKPRITNIGTKIISSMSLLGFFLYYLFLFGSFVGIGEHLELGYKLRSFISYGIYFAIFPVSIISVLIPCIYDITVTKSQWRLNVTISATTLLLWGVHIFVSFLEWGSDIGGMLFNSQIEKTHLFFILTVLILVIFSISRKLFLLTLKKLYCGIIIAFLSLTIFTIFEILEVNDFLISRCDRYIRSNLSWSPDGSKITFVRMKVCNKVYYELCVVGTQPCIPKVLHSGNISQEAGFFSTVAWSPKGDKIAYSIEFNKHPFSASSKDLWIFNIGERKAALIASPGGAPIFSKNGEFIFFKVYPDGAYIIREDGSGLKQKYKWLIEYPVWSSEIDDFTTLVHLLNKSAEQNHLEGFTSRTEINSLNIAHLSWSPEGDKFIFIKKYDGRELKDKPFLANTIYLYSIGYLKTEEIKVKTKREYEMYNLDLFRIQYPSWSFDGTRIAYFRESNIFIANIDGTGEQIITGPYAKV